MRESKPGKTSVIAFLKRNFRKGGEFLFGFAANSGACPAFSFEKRCRVPKIRRGFLFWAVAIACPFWLQLSCASRSSQLLHLDNAAMNRRAPEVFDVRLETTKGNIEIEVHREWAPRGADRFYNLVRAGYYDDSRFYRVIQGKWAQFGINGDPKISNVWRERTFADDPRVESNTRGTVAFAFAVPNGRTTQVFINLRDNSATHDAEFAPFGKIVRGMAVADALNTEYGETAGSGIRSGKQGPLFEHGNAYLDKNFPRLDRILRAKIAARAGKND
jgi:peptidyl-prolyl cis-trans isomerase A (cyclophilin A)